MSSEKISTLPTLSSLDPSTYLSGIDTSGTIVQNVKVSAELFINSPAFTGSPTSTTPAIGDNSTNIATTAFVQETVTGLSLSAGVSSVNGRAGAVTLSISDIPGVAPLASPVFTGTPESVTPVISDNSTKIATTAFVQENISSLGSLSGIVTSVAGRTGAVTLSVTDVTGAAPLASPTFTGTPLSVTPVSTDNSTKIATTAFVQENITTSTISVSQISNIGNITGQANQFIGFNSSAVPVALSKATAQSNLSISKATMTVFFAALQIGAYTLSQQLPAGFSFDSVDVSCQSGSFVIGSITLSGTAITGFSNITVNSTTNTNIVSTGSQIGAVGNTVILNISAQTPATGNIYATGGTISLNLTRM